MQPSEPSRIVDLSLDVYPGAPAFPGDPRFEVHQHDTIATTGYNLTRMCLGTHQGTHLDAPLHFVEGGRAVDQIDLRRCVGPATLIDLSHKQPGDDITVADFASIDASIRPGARILYRLGWDRVFPDARYFTDFPGMTPELARWLASRRIALIGMDCPSPHPTLFRDVHLPLLEADIVIVEGLAHLDEVAVGEMFFVAAPLRLRGLDGSPVRAFAIIESPQVVASVPPG